MNFFEAQDQARRASRWLVLVYAIATALIVAGVSAVVGLALYLGSPAPTGTAEFVAAHAPILISAALVTLLFVVGASVYKSAALSAGGGRVATQMGGTLVPANVTDPLRRRLRNVVEEMSIASGVPVPDIYVLEQEAAINAFAAGYDTGDAAIAVTRGTLELLDRDELQGVIAHEFSHVLNGDMRLNIRLMGVLFGILAIGLIGRTVLRGSRHGRFLSGRRNGGGAAVLIVGLGLALLGSIGVFFSRIIKAAVSRTRERLADASAVQFTRQTAGLAGALKKIGGYTSGSRLTATDPEEISHMLFSPGARLAGLFATHPPLTERIRALDPAFREKDWPEVTDALRRNVIADAERHQHGAAPAVAAIAATPGRIAGTVGAPQPGHIAYAEKLRASIPERLYEAAHSADDALLLALALLLTTGGNAVSRQLALLEEQLGDERRNEIARLHELVAEHDPMLRLPLLEIAFPALRQRPQGQLEYLLRLARRIIELDGRIELSEYCYYRIFAANFGRDRQSRRRRRGSRENTRTAAIELLMLVADRGHESAADRGDALAAGLAELGIKATEPVRSDNHPSVRELDHALDTLQALDGDGRRRIVRGVGAVAARDGRLELAEAELVRAVCAALDCPLPPILPDPLEAV